MSGERDKAGYAVLQRNGTKSTSRRFTGAVVAGAVTLLCLTALLAAGFSRSDRSDGTRCGVKHTFGDAQWGETHFLRGTSGCAPMG